MSHFACADESESAMTAEQAQRFDKIAAAFPGTIRSLANSSGVFRNNSYHYDLVRPGMAMYGLNPTPEAGNPMQPTVSLAVRLLQVRDAAKGETVGYGASHKLKKNARIGTVALGYADGFLRSGSGKATLYYEGAACPVVGRVSMDLVTVDLGATDAVAGHSLEVLGPDQDADTLAESLGTIGYEVLTGLGRRWGRHYIGAGKAGFPRPAVFD
jgi:alanine racemase